MPDILQRGKMPGLINSSLSRCGKCIIVNLVHDYNSLDGSGSDIGAADIVLVHVEGGITHAD